MATLGGPGGPKIPGPLPGMIGKPGGAPLPGVGRPGGLPGMGKPGVPGLPGFGAQKGAAAVHSAVSGTPAAAVLKKKAAEQARRDPFATKASAGAVTYDEVAVVVPGADERALSGADERPKMSARTRGIFVGVGAGLIIVGIIVGSLVAGRVEQAMKVRDARIAKIEIEKLNKVFAIVDEQITKASAAAQQGTFDRAYMKVLNENLQGNPFNPSLFTDRNYKNFEPATIDALNTYYDQWAELYSTLGTHFRRTENDEPELAASDAEYAKGDPLRYGVVFARNEESGALLANVVVLGKKETKDGQLTSRIQTEVGIYGDSRTYYNGKPGDAELGKAPETYVIEVAPQSEGDLLADAPKPHFEQYKARLKALADLVARMRESQQALKTAVDKIAAESAPSLLTGLDIEEDVEEYQRAAAKAAEAVATGGAGEKAAE